MSVSGRERSLSAPTAEALLFAMAMSQQSVFDGMGTACSTRLLFTASGPV